MLGSAQTSSPSAQTVFTTLYSFCSQGAYPHCADGLYPIYGGLVQISNGNLYGTTALGGAYFNPNSCCGGTVFRITPNGKLTTLYSFCAQTDCADGNSPQAGLVQTTNGDLYGTTAGGAYNAGNIFKITPSGSLVSVYSFCALGLTCPDGSSPLSRLIQATDGNLYGTTGTGGTRGEGTVFKITSSGDLTTLYNFCSQTNCADGINPGAGLIQANDGNFYGTTYSGGADFNPPNYGSGTVFKITPSGVFTTLYNFCSQPACSDGFNPSAGLIQAADGNFYGTTYENGVPGGTAFKITPAGELTTLYRFCAQGGFACTDGSSPIAGLIQATDGNLYGTTASGGTYGGGTIYTLSPGGTLATLYSFCSQGSCADGSSPYAGVTQSTNGEFYGATYEGGANGYGAIFKLSVGLGPFVAVQSASGKVGAAVRILGDNLIGATAVTFNGTKAKFIVVSKSDITTTVPTGATTGIVQVTTPSGTLASNVVYTVEPNTKAPVFSLAPGVYVGQQSVSIFDKTAGAIIYYTTDGTEPANSPTARAYAGPVTISNSETLKAIALGPDDENSSVTAAEYTINHRESHSQSCCDGKSEHRFDGDHCFEPDDTRGRSWPDPPIRVCTAATLVR